MKRQLVVEAPAKVNLTLDVLAKRPDGYHELATVMHQISLMDKLSLQLTDTAIIVHSSNPVVPEGEENLAYRAARLLFERFSLAGGVHIYIDKNIPVGAGLAGGSTDAAAVLMGLNILFELGLPLEHLQSLGLELGSDVPFCILGGTALAKGRGEILAPLPGGPRLEMVLIKPDFQLSTAAIYQGLQLDKPMERPDNRAFIEAWQECDIISMTSVMQNVLESVSLAKCPEIAIIKSKLVDAGALTALMSGSGPSVVGIFSSLEQARRGWEKLKDQYQEAYLVSSYCRGD